MKWTFGIITNNDPVRMPYLIEAIKSIYNLNIPKKDFEILIIGNVELNNNDNIHIITFDETIKPNWITKKKNIITEEAKFDNIVYQHNYVVYHPDWYKEFLNFGEDWEVCMTSIRSHADTFRYRDWLTWNPSMFLEYDDYRFLNKMYISGAFWCAKKDFMKKYPLNEELSWDQGEDVEWSERAREVWNYKCNPNSKNAILVQKGHATRGFIKKTDPIEKHSWEYADEDYTKFNVVIDF